MASPPSSQGGGCRRPSIPWSSFSGAPILVQAGSPHPTPTSHPTPPPPTPPHPPPPTHLPPHPTGRPTPRPQALAEVRLVSRLLGAGAALRAPPAAPIPGAAEAALPPLPPLPAGARSGGFLRGGGREHGPRQARPFVFFGMPTPSESTPQFICVLILGGVPGWPFCSVPSLPEIRTFPSFLGRPVISTPEVRYVVLPLRVVGPYWVRFS